MRDLEQKPAEGKSEGHLILTKQSKHLVQKLENIQENINVLRMLQCISSSSWTPKRSHEPQVKKERKTLSKMNIAQSVNFPILPPQQGHKQLRVLIAGALLLTYFALTQSFFRFLTLYRWSMYDPTELIALCQLT